MTTTATATTTQQRGVCPACFRVQALTAAGCLVNHGYSRPQHWHQNVNTCEGAGLMHFGTAAGRDHTARIAARLRTGADEHDALAAEIAAGTAPVYRRQGIPKSRLYTMVVVDAPTADQRARYAASKTKAADIMRMQASEFEGYVAEWTPAEPRTVAAEKKTTLVHWYWDRLRGKACASSVMGAQRGWATHEIANVTCEKCKARYAKFGGGQ